MNEKKRVNVMPNPYGFMHHLLGPQGACPQDPHEHANPQVRRFVGAKMRSASNGRQDFKDAKGNVLKDFQKYRNLQLTWFEFADKPVSIPLTHYYRDRLRDGDIVPGDDECRKTVGARGARFKDIEEAKAAAKEKYDAEHTGDDVLSFDELCKKAKERIKVLSKKPTKKKKSADKSEPKPAEPKAAPKSSAGAKENNK